MMDPQIIFQGIECPEMRSQLKCMMDDIIEKCPSDSAIKATFSHIHDRFLAEVNIASESVSMRATDEANGLMDCLDHVKSKLLSQIVNWRNHRFAS